MTTVTGTLRRTIRGGGLLTCAGRIYRDDALAAYIGQQAELRLLDAERIEVRVAGSAVVIHPIGESPAESTAGWRPAEAPFHDPQRSSIMCTSYLLMAERAINEVIDEQGIGLIHGDPGLGKTFSLDWALRDLPAVSLRFPSKPTPRETVARLYEALTGQPVARRTRFTLEREVRDLLADSPRVIAVDEAEYLTAGCMDLLRQLHDAPETQFALLLVGSRRCVDVIRSDPRLDSRIYHRVQFRPLDEQTVLKVIPGYHPIYRDVPHHLIVEINDRHAKGRLRDWARFTNKAYRICTEFERGLDKDVIDAVLAA